SPEQVRGEAITTATDVYSLRVILYRLLTGHAPYMLNSRDPLKSMHTISETEPERPSTVIERVEEVSVNGEVQLVTPERLCEARNERHSLLRRRLAGDLDNIVLKALRKEPGRRYASAEQLSEDIQRYLEGLPVLARSDTFGYRTGKFIQRNKAGVGATSPRGAPVQRRAQARPRSHARCPRFDSVSSRSDSGAQIDHPGRARVRRQPGQGIFRRPFPAAGTGDRL